MAAPRTTHDVLIVGAGPGGCELAWRMATAGFDVLVLEKASLDREKPCGGGIQLQELVEFGDPPPHVIERTIDRVRMITPGNRVLEIEGPGGGRVMVTVRRSVFDGYLQQRARDAGAVLREHARVVEVRDERAAAVVTALEPDGPRTYAARLVVNAAGSGAVRLTRQLGIADDSPQYSVTWALWATIPGIEAEYGNIADIYTLPEIPQGYAWVFPKRDVLSVGIGATADSVKARGLDLRGLLTRMMDEHPLASRKLRGYEVIQSAGSLIRVGLAERLAGPRAIVLGDAAGLANLIHGGGIYQARKSAAIAAPFCERFLRTGHERFLAAYDRAARSHFSRYELDWDRRIRRAFWNHHAMEALVKEGQSDAGLKTAMRILLTSTEPHRRAYQRLERKMLDVVYAELSSQTDRFRTTINDRLREVFPAHAFLHRYANEILLSDSSKRLRAYLVILSAELFGGDVDSAVDFSLVYEIFHTASLVHDDIMDGSERRRGRKTLHAKYGLDHAIVTGDLLLARGYSLFGQFARRHRLPDNRLHALLEVVGDSGHQCCVGQSLDLRMARRGQYGSIDSYLRMVDLKTGSLISGATRGGALLAGAGAAHAAAMERLGRNLGIAFQIVDDSLDLLGGASARKSLRNDLKQGKATPMLIHALHHASPAEKRWVLDAVGRPDLDGPTARRILHLYRHYDAVRFTQQLSHRYVDKARRELAALPANEARDRLGDIAEILDYWSLLAGESEWHAPASSAAAAGRPDGPTDRADPEERGEAPRRYRPNQ